MNLESENIYFGAVKQLADVIDLASYSQLFVLCDTNTSVHCFPLFQQAFEDYSFHLLTMSAGEEHKIMSTCESIWRALIDHGADRHSLFINLGGGVVGDLGGFCAATYMRGMDVIQIPTSLLAQVDASVGGKTAIDFLHYKNMVGLFQSPKGVFIDSMFLKTLPAREWKNGYVELV